MSGCVEGRVWPHPAPPAHHKPGCSPCLPGQVLGTEREHGLLVDHPHPHPPRLPGRGAPATPRAIPGGWSQLLAGVRGWREGGRAGPGAGLVHGCPPYPQINLLIFMRILKVILAKLRANQKGYADYKLR